jgi:hypothetical protein
MSTNRVEAIVYQTIFCRGCRAALIAVVGVEVWCPLCTNTIPNPQPLEETLHGREAQIGPAFDPVGPGEQNSGSNFFINRRSRETPAERDAARASVEGMADD